MRLLPCTPKSTNTLRICNIYCFRLQQWLKESASVPCCTYIAYLVITGTQCVHCAVRNMSLNIIRLTISVLKGRAMSQLVILRPHTTYARVRSWDSEYEIYGEKSDIWTRFSDGISVFPVYIIPPILRTHIHIHAAFNRSAN